jgi:hypothetical protein
MDRSDMGYSTTRRDPGCAKTIAGRSVRLDNVKPFSLRFNVEIVKIRTEWCYAARRIL